MTLETLLPQLEFQAIIEDAVTQKITKNRRQVDAIVATAYSSGDFEFPLCTRMPYAISSKQNCLRYKSLQRVGIESKIKKSLRRNKFLLTKSKMILL